MKPTKISTLAYWFLVVLVVGSLATRLLVANGVVMPVVPALTSVVLLAFATYLLVAGLPIRARVHGDGKRRIDAIGAARHIRMVQASSLGGACLMGLYGSQVVAVANLLAFEAQRSKAIFAGVAAICSLILVLVALIVEKWCTLPPDEFDDGMPGPTSELEGA